MRIPVPEIQTALTHFFEKMSRVVNSLEGMANTKATEKDTKNSSKRARNEPALDKDHFEWIINRPQTDRILEHLNLLNEYIENRNVLRNPITRFGSLVNEFLSQTNKKVNVGGSGQLTVSVNKIQIRVQ